MISLNNINSLALRLYIYIFNVEELEKKNMVHAGIMIFFFDVNEIQKNINSLTLE